jgi:hypothetical protein
MIGPRWRNARIKRTFTLDRECGSCRRDGGSFNKKLRRIALTLSAPRGVVMQFQETILGRLGKALHVHVDDITHEPLPRRWVELIHCLDEQERKRGTKRLSD